MLLKIEEPVKRFRETVSDEEVVVGIDLGTTNSLIAIFDDDKISLIEDEFGNVIHPSIISFSKENNISCGVAVKDCSHCDRKIYSIKRLMGKPDSVKDDKGKLCKITAEEVSAEILKYLKNLAHKKTGKEILKAIITVPAYFDESARNATKNAARIAGLEVLRLINEPTSAALAYGLDKNIYGTYCIFDLGGGTFDISILKLKKGIFKVIGVGGDANFGGDDIDDLIVEYIKNNVDINSFSEENYQYIKNIAQKAKEGLTEQNEVGVKFLIGEKSYELSISNSQLNKIIDDSVERLIGIVKKLISELEVESIDGIVLVGGSTKIPLIKEKLSESFGKEKVFTNIDPDKVVVMGAAIQSKALTSGFSNLLLDVIPLSLGIELMGGIVEKIISRNSQIPISVSKEFTTYVDGQNGIKLHIVQGEREFAKDCISIANLEIKNIPPLKSGIPRIGVTFIIDADGLLTIEAENKANGEIISVDINPTYGLDEKKVKEILLESQRNAKGDIEKRVKIENSTNSLKS